MGNLTESIKSHAFFEGFSVEHVQRIARYASKAAFHPGEYIFREGETAKQFYLVEEGRVALEIQIPNYGAVAIDRLTKGTVLGWSWLSPPHQWQLDARASEDVETIVLDGNKIREEMKNDYELGYHMMEKISSVVEKRLQATRAKLVEFYKIFPTPDNKSRAPWEKLL